MVMELRKARKSLKMTQATLAKKHDFPEQQSQKLNLAHAMLPLHTYSMAHAMGKRVEIRLI